MKIFKRKRTAPNRLIFQQSAAGINKKAKRSRRKKIVSQKQVFQAIGKPSRLKNFFQYLGIGGGVALLALVVLFLFGGDYFRVKHIDVKRNKLLTDSSQILEAVSDYYERNMWLVSSSEIEKALLKTFPILSEVKVVRDLPDRIKIELISYPIVANIHFEVAMKSAAGESVNSPNLQNEYHKSLVNQEGYVVSLNKEDLSLPEIYLIDQAEVPIQNSLVIKEAHLTEILRADRIINESLNLKVKRIKYFSYGREMHFETENGPTIWLDFEDSVENQLEKLIKHTAEFDLENNPPIYFDLRIKNKLIYK